jgi:hypothetical protein
VLRPERSVCSLRDEGNSLRSIPWVPQGYIRVEYANRDKMSRSKLHPQHAWSLPATVCASSATAGTISEFGFLLYFPFISLSGDCYLFYVSLQCLTPLCSGVTHMDKCLTLASLCCLRVYRLRAEGGIVLIDLGLIPLPVHSQCVLFPSPSCYFNTCQVSGDLSLAPIPWPKHLTLYYYTNLSIRLELWTYILQLSNLSCPPNPLCLAEIHSLCSPAC